MYVPYHCANLGVKWCLSSDDVHVVRKVSPLNSAYAYTFTYIHIHDIVLVHTVSEVKVFNILGITGTFHKHVVVSLLHAFYMHVCCTDMDCTC